jgi:Ca-activated chloride channel family protein
VRLLAALSVLIVQIPVFAWQMAGDDVRVNIESRVRSTAPVAESFESRPAHLKVDVNLVVIPVHVTNRAGENVTTLEQKHFRLFEDGVEQDISHFTKDDAPLSIGLLFDMSGSMRNKMRKASEAALEFFKTANTADEFFLIEFNTRVKLAVPFTEDSDEVYRHIQRARPAGRTSLLDAIHMAMVQMKNARNPRRAIVILSDGGDNSSRYSAHEIKNALAESEIQLYAMGIFDPEDSKKQTSEERNGPRLLDELAAQSGGKHYPVKDLDDLPLISAQIGNELRSQYVLGYSPLNASTAGKYKRVTITLGPPDGTPPLKAAYRQGYYSPK